MNSDTALVVLSGGQDSTTCLFEAVRKFKRVHAITFDYGQLHSREVQSARWVAELAGVESHEVLELPPDILAGTSPLTNKNVLLEQYADFRSLPGGLEKTFVPGRNILFLTLAANRAYVLEAQTIVTGLCQEDSGGYPDCRDYFRDSLEVALVEGLGLQADVLKIHTPLMYLTKADSVRLAYDDKACWNALAFSHTSYDGAYPPTGHDHATLLREKGFVEAGLPDPLILRAFFEGLMDLPQTDNYYRVRRNDAGYTSPSINMHNLLSSYRLLGLPLPLKPWGDRG